ncbi:RsmB/NOP family class I SAM-dependent RNA methyltransferase [Actibacterium ureilyticum]|uniref:RsmB/NOP family class I SAM-dependent RNA methyltransferase n=1 Tax=Actibacterium ureilyticum TaxID=1590614 RepID=UPI000BAB23A3|nr:RsmB/NOP family class I SAM-dependent RNA methyltransferase [Actibacterium ureilyticum]
MASQTDRARGAAVALLNGVLDEGLTLGELTGEVGPLTDLDGPDRARAQRLATMTLRHLDRADAMLKPLMRRPPPMPVRNVLRLAVCELFVNGAAPHGVVNTAVNLLRADRKGQAMAGMANAVLRKLGDADPADWAKLPPQKLPGWLRGRLDSQYKRAIVTAIEEAHAMGAPLDLTPRGGKAAELAERLGGTMLPTGSVRLRDPGQVSTLPGYETGDWWVQDAAAALPARILNPAKGEVVFDLCAAPGGKTLQLADAGAKVTAVDVSADRMERVAENLSRMGLTAETVTADVLTWEPPAPADAILLDAPCSATGTIRRHPDLPFAKTAKGIKPLFALQAQMIDRAVALLRPGGRLVFCTCSLLAEEGEAQLSAALERHADLSVTPDALALPGIDPAWIDDLGGLRLRPDFWPDLGGMDGFYIASLRKAG